MDWAVFLTGLRGERQDAEDGEEGEQGEEEGEQGEEGEGTSSRKEGIVLHECLRLALNDNRSPAAQRIARSLLLAGVSGRRTSSSSNWK